MINDNEQLSALSVIADATERVISDRRKRGLPEYEGDPYMDRPDGYMERLAEGWHGIRYKGQSYRARRKGRSSLWEIAGLGPVYEADAEEMVCQCPHHIHRLSAGEPCKHLKAVLYLMSLLGEPSAPASENEMTEEELRTLFA